MNEWMNEWMKILMVKRNHRTIRVWKTTCTCPNTITYIYTHKKIQKRHMVKCGPAGMRACSLGLVGLGLGLVLGIGLVFGLTMVLRLADFTFCHTSSPHPRLPAFYPQPTKNTRELENYYRHKFAKSTQSSIRLKTLELEAATIVRGKAFQISTTRFNTGFRMRLCAGHPLSSTIYDVYSRFFPLSTCLQSNALQT